MDNNDNEGIIDISLDDGEIVLVDETIATPDKDSETDSSSSSDSDDSDDDDDDFLASLAQVQGGDDDIMDEDEDGPTRPAGAPRTVHELEKPELLPIDDVTIAPSMPLEVAGVIHMVVEDQVIIRSSRPGDAAVLDDGTVFAFDDRTVLGRLYETFGPVANPLFSVRFPSSAHIDRERMVVGRTVHFVPDMAMWALTEQLRALRGCDASNAFDEEVDEREMEFSDDEQEVDFRRRLKQAKFARADDPNNPRSKRARTQGGRPTDDSTAAAPGSGPSISDMFSQYSTPTTTPAAAVVKREPIPARMQAASSATPSLSDMFSQYGAPAAAALSLGLGRGRGGRAPAVADRSAALPQAPNSSSWAPAVALPPKPPASTLPPIQHHHQPQQASGFSSLATMGQSAPPAPPPIPMMQSAGTMDATALAALVQQQQQYLQTLQAMQALQQQQQQLQQQQQAGISTTDSSADATAAVLAAALSDPAMTSALLGLLGQQQQQPPQQQQQPPIRIETPPAYRSVHDRSGGRVRVLAPGVLGVERTDDVGSNDKRD
ncbi:Gar1/Naf1 RNA binding region-domain-containing protein [Blastocladiella britannica]|nr:Gar1/Naf1 RNA binding region-domain-containing protein [Blastocladiella britannica]